MQKTGNIYYGEEAIKYYEKRHRRKKWKVENAILEKYISCVSSGSKVLDIPFGTGRFVDAYIKKDMKIYGMDISKDMIEAAKNQLGDRYSMCNIIVRDVKEGLPFEDGFFDLIVCFRFLKFFSYEEAMWILSEFNRVLRPDATIILRMRVLSYYLGGDYTYNREEPIGSRIQEKDLSEMIENSGFDILQKRNLRNRFDRMRRFMGCKLSLNNFRKLQNPILKADILVYNLKKK